MNMLLFADIGDFKVSLTQLALLAVAGGALIAIRYAFKLVANVKAAITTAVAGLALVTGWGGSKIYQGMQFDAKVKDYVVAAYKTDDKAKAKKYLTSALDYLKDTGANKGHAAVFAGGQTDDLQEWTDDLTKVLEDMDTPDTVTKTTLVKADTAVSASETIPAVIKTEQVPSGKKDWKNRLKELRFIEQPDENNIDSAKVRHPEGMGLAPYNFYYFMWGTLGLTTLAAGTGWTATSITLRRKREKQAKCHYCNRTTTPTT